MFVIKCKSCNWNLLTTGFSKDIAHLVEIKGGCSKCGKPRRFKCPECGNISIMTRKTR